MENTIQFLKIRDVKSPSRAYDYDAGIDFYVPVFNTKFIKDLKSKNPIIWPVNNEYSGPEGTYYNSGSGFVFQGPSDTKVEYDLKDINDTRIKFDDKEGQNYFLLVPGARVNIPSGIKLRLATPGRALVAFNKSGIATKYGLVAGACVVDYLYQGEIHLSLINTSTKVVRIYEDMKILQFIEMPVFNSEISIETAPDEVPVMIGRIPTPPEKFYEGMQTDRGEDGFDSTKNK
jgi:dUTPase